MRMMGALASMPKQSRTMVAAITCSLGAMSVAVSPAFSQAMSDFRAVEKTATISIPSGGGDGIQVDCPAGLVAIGGGAVINPSSASSVGGKISLHSMWPAGSQFHAAWMNHSNETVKMEVSAVAHCAKVK
jgi:hypothetical protein